MSAPATLDRAGILARIPHQGRMCLWDAVEGWDATHVRLSTLRHLEVDHPLRHRGQLSAVHLCEFGAQGMAVHGGLLAEAGTPPRPGRLVALRDVRLQVARIDDLAGPLVGEATLMANGEASQLYRFRILHAGVEIATGRATVALL